MIAGRYDPEREIGRGGMGAVWLGRDRVLGREVALKRIGLLPGVQSPDVVRAEREARLAARLNHPHVVAVWDLVEDEDETWLVMEYVEGTTLSALVQRDGALGPDRAAPLLRQAADALAAAHAAGIVHRDVKPSNMLVTREGQVKLSDFGIARAEADASLTRTGLLTGSPAYLAPEVASGRTATEASDVWSLGATLYHLLAGRPPYDVEQNLMGALYRIVHEDPPRLANAGWLTPVLERTMTREPADRWSMAQVRDHLDGARNHAGASGGVAPDVRADGTQELPVVASPRATPPPVPTGARPPADGIAPTVPAARRRRSAVPWLAAAAVLAMVVLVVAVALAFRGGDSPTTSPGSGGSPGSGHSSSPPASQAQAAEMRSFVTSYLATVTGDQAATWKMLTPSFQEASHGFASYQRFWQGISSASPHGITADPAAGTVSYDVDYVKTDGSTTSDQVTLLLVPHGSTYLINGEG